jgi:hypothetical protein
MISASFSTSLGHDLRVPVDAQPSFMILVMRLRREVVGLLGGSCPTRRAATRRAARSQQKAQHVALAARPGNLGGGARPPAPPAFSRSGSCLLDELRRVDVALHVAPGLEAARALRFRSRAPRSSCRRSSRVPRRGGCTSTWMSIRLSMDRQTSMKLSTLSTPWRSM